jgi:hypothetical protein
MLLGIARTAATAGWGTRPGENLTSSISDTTVTTTTGGGILLRPTYSADFSTTSATQQVQTFTFADSATAIDMTGTGTNAKKEIYAMTFRVGTNWMTTAPSTYTQAYAQFVQFNNNGTQSFRPLTLAQEPGGANYVFGSGSGVNVYVNKALFDANYRNKWLTCIYSTSDTSADFANWAGGTDTYGNSWACRARLYETETMTPIPSVYSNQGDGWLFDNTGSVPDLTQAWDLNAGTYNFNPFGYFDNDSTLYYRTDLEIMSVWYTVGNMVDIGNTEYSNQLAGSAFSKTVNSIKPWIAYAFHGAGTPVINSGDTYAYTNPVATWGRMPAAKVQIGVTFGTPSPQPAQYISL